MRESKKARAERVDAILARLDAEYGTEYRCYLDHETPWQLLIAVILSAQCADARVNIVTKELFKKYRSLEDFAAAELSELEQDIHSTGFYHMKAKNIISCCKDLVEKHGGTVPRELSELTALAGVGRKTANVIRGNVYDDPSIVVDTHVKRISKKLGLTKAVNPEKVEYELMEVLPKDHWSYGISISSPWAVPSVLPEIPSSQCFLRELCPSAEVEGMMAERERNIVNAADSYVAIDLETTGIRGKAGEDHGDRHGKGGKRGSDRYVPYPGEPGSSHTGAHYGADRDR